MSEKGIYRGKKVFLGLLWALWATPGHFVAPFIGDRFFKKGR